MKNNDVNELMHSVIQRIAVGPDMGKDIAEQEAEQVMNAILNNQVQPVQAAIFLIALRMKRESIEEYAGILNAMQLEQQETIADIDELLYIADPYDGYVRHLPMSPFLPAVLAANGLPAIMQGVRSVGPKHGVTTHQVLELYGANVMEGAAEIKTRLEDTGWAYYDQSKAYPKLFALNEFRDLIVKRTALTTLERVLKPISAKQKNHLLLGYVHKAYPEIYADMSMRTGFNSALLVKGVEGGVTPALNKPVRSYYIANGNMTDKQIAQDGCELLDREPTGSGVLIKELPKQAALAEQTLEVGLAVLSDKAKSDKVNIARDSLVLAASTTLFGLKKSGINVCGTGSSTTFVR